MTSVIIGTYFGAWPIWLPAFLLSCARNERIDWLLVTDCPTPPVSYDNVQFLSLSLAELNRRASTKLELDIQKERYSQLDLRPAYGVIFEEEIGGHDFWGHCDLDVVWGDVCRFITPEILERVDIASSRKHATSGHLTFWRNNERLNQLYKQIDDYESVLQDPEHRNFDERLTSKFLRSGVSAGSDIRIHWPENKVVGWPVLEQRPRGWRWIEGRLFDSSEKEHVYMHFMTWKDSMRHIDFGFEDAPESFSVTRRGIWASSRPLSEKILDLVPVDRWLTEGFRKKEVHR